MENTIKSLILAVDNSQLAAAFRLSDRLLLSGKRPCIFTLCDNQKAEGKYTVRSLKHYQKIFKIDYSYIKRETYDLFHSLADIKLNNRISLKDAAMYENVSLWDLSAIFFFPELASVLYEVNMALAILDLEKPGEVHLIDGAYRWEKIFCLACRKADILCFIRHKRAIFSPLKKIQRNSLNFLKKLKRFLLSLGCFLKNSERQFKVENKCGIVFFTPLERFFNVMLPVILQYDEKERLVINTFGSSIKQKLDRYKIPYKDFNGYKIYGLYDFRALGFVRKIWGIIKSDKTFFLKIVYKQLPIGEVLVDLFEKAVNEGFSGRIREVDIVRKILLSYRPKVAVVTDCLFDITSIAKSLSVPVVALQCGHAEEFVLFRPLAADAATVDGEYWKEYLSRKNTPADKIWVTGSPQFDLLTKRPVDADFSLKRNEKKVVYASIYSSLALGMLDYERTEQIHLVFNAMKKIKNAHLTVKLHPYDNDAETYERIAKETGITNYSIVRNTDMLEVLNNSDLLITHLSKASYEAVLMDKNVILLCYNSDFILDDVWDFKRYAAVAAVDSLEDLENCISKVLFDPDESSRLKMNRKKYIFDHGYQIDGKAAERVKEVINRFV